MINYNLLAKAQKYYGENGYEFIEVPWMVSKECDEITKPNNMTPMIIEYNNKHLIASGEQGFLYLYMKGYLPNGKYQTITPCFRNEPFDVTHQKMFMKCELITFLDHNASREEIKKVLDKTKDDAHKFFCSIAKYPDWISEIKTHNIENTAKCRLYANYDIEYEGFEIGSYGVREYNDMLWVYGTGLAEPRFSKVDNIIYNNLNSKQ